MSGREKMRDCDVLVIGAGVSGYCAAIAAAREGCETVLLEMDGVLGGNGGPNLGVGITGADRYHSYAGETGIIHEIQEEAAWIDAYTHFKKAGAYTISRRHEAVVQQYLEDSGALVLKRHYAREAVTDGSRIVAATADDLAAFRTVRVNVRHIVIEASGDGHIGALAGADFDFGSESQAEFDERSAPPERSRRVQGSSIVAIAHKTDQPVRFVPPLGTPEELSHRLWHGSLRGFLHHHGGYFKGRGDIGFLYITEAGGDMDTILEEAEIHERLLRQLWAEWNHIKNGPHADEALEWDLLWVSPKTGKRESRRFLGDYVLTQTDLEAGRQFDDDVAYGGHDLDDHRPLPGGHSDIYAHSIPPLYGIPFRCCYSRNIDNLLLGGRLISETHLAHSSSRVMRTGAAIGQAVGTAAAMCSRHSCSPRALGQSHIAELQHKLLRADATILARPVGQDDDLAPSATVHATSETRFNDQASGQPVPLLKPVGNVLWDWPRDLEWVEVYVENDSDVEQPVELSVYRAAPDRRWTSMHEYRDCGWNDLRFPVFRRLASRETAAEPGFEGWHRIALSPSLQLDGKDPTHDGDRLLVALNGNSYLKWAAATGVHETAAGVEHFDQIDEWRPLSAMMTMRLGPAPGLGEAANAVNGFHRRFSIAPLNVWMSDPAQPLPQTLSLSWAEPQTFSRVSVTFDNLARTMHDNPWEYGPRAMPQLVKSYALEAELDAGGWTKIAEAQENYHRHRVHTFDPATATGLRLRVLATHGQNQPARVYQVRVHR